MTCASACAAWGGYYEAWAAAAFFGYVAMILYGVDCFFKFKGWRQGDVAQGAPMDMGPPPEMMDPSGY